MDIAAPVLAAVAVLILVYYARSFLTWKARSRGRPLPPGPPRLPVVGNLFNAPRSKPWYGFRDLCTDYGDVVYLEALGQRTVVLGSADAIREFLEKRTTNTSDRPTAPIVHLTGNDWILGLIPYGQRWRSYRRAIWQYFHPDAINKYYPKLLDNPEDFRKHIRFSLFATMLKIGYGIDVEDEENEIIRVIDDALEGAAQARVPGRFLVDFFPPLQYVPAWVPGAGFQKSFARWRDASARLKNAPFVQRNTAFTENVVHWPHASMYKTFSVLEAVFLAMSLFPEVQRKAQAELDAVVGRGRLPGVKDRQSLIYVNALGFFIPGGTTLIANIWACMHDPHTWEQPDEFRPERFIRDDKLDHDVMDPFNIVFGSGRRICPGRYFADTALFLNVANVLHVFDIGPPLDEQGKPIRIRPEVTDGFLSYLENSRCTIKPRSVDAEALITSTNTGPE
ncbi:cytochrome P450 [Fomes fomentarius]|nr:cytochrome P450 [Fomes fomentarius]